MTRSNVGQGALEEKRKKKRKKAMGGGVMDMTRMKYLKGGQV